MISKHIIHIFGASGSGTSSLGRALAEELGFRFMDTDDYLWLPTDPKYTQLRPDYERVKMISADIDEAENIVLSGSLSGWGDALIPSFTLAVRVNADTETRLERLKKREYDKFGSRILPGGDMYNQHQAFLEWAAKYDSGGPDMRSRTGHELWQRKLLCPLITVDGTENINELILEIRKEIIK